MTHEKTRKPLPKVYTKVYARMKDGSVKFFKDGYTDLRGRCDYTSLSTNDLDHVTKFSLLVLSEEHDRFRWADLATAVAKCRPEQVATTLKQVGLAVHE